MKSPKNLDLVEKSDMNLPQRMLKAVWKLRRDRGFIYTFFLDETRR